MSSRTKAIIACIFTASLLLLGPHALASNVNWTGAGDGVSWSDPLNWSGNERPGPSDDVNISVPGSNPTILLNNAAGNVQIQSFNCSEAFSITGGSLTVGGLASTSNITGAFTASGGSFTATGENASFAASGPANLQNLTIRVSGGASASFPALTDLSGLTNIEVGGQNSRLSFPAVISYTQPANRRPVWRAGSDNMNNAGCKLQFPALATITGTVPTNQNTDGSFYIQAYYGAAIEFPALTSVTVPAASFPNNSSSGVKFLARDSNSLITAPLLTTFSDNSTTPQSSLTAYSSGRLDFSLLTTPVGIQMDLNAVSNPQQFTSITGTTSFRLNAGTVTMPVASVSGDIRAANDNTVLSFPNVTSLVDVTNIEVGGQNSRLSFPAVISYTQPANRRPVWRAGSDNMNNAGCKLQFPALATITGTVPTNQNTDGSFYIQAYYGAAIEFPALTSVTVPAASFPSNSSSGVRFLARDTNSLITAPLLATFSDNSTTPQSSLTASSGGTISVPNLTEITGVTINIGKPFTIASGINYIASGSLQGNVTNDGFLIVNQANQTLQIGGWLAGTGSVSILNGTTLSLSGSLTVDQPGSLILAASSTLAVGGDLLGSTTNVKRDLPGTVLFKGAGSEASPQQLEVMSDDLGAVPAGFENNFVFGNLSLANNTRVKLVDLANNTPATGAECIYSNSIVVPAGCTLDLNGLKLYARAAQIGGNVANGTITQIADSGNLALATPTPGNISVPGELDEWVFYGRAGSSVSIVVNLGASAPPVPVSPKMPRANVQVLAPSGEVLAGEPSDTAGASVTLTDIALPSDGSYRIRVNAPASHTGSTGNYIVGVWDVTPSVRPLVLGQEASGNIASLFAVEQWTFSAVAGQQIQFDLLRSTTSGISYSLSGPGGYVGFEGLTDDSPLINLPTSGAYTLKAAGPTGETGSYKFVIRQSGITPLVLGSAYTGNWVGSGQAQLFVLPVTTTQPLLIDLADSVASHHTEIYARFGTPPTRQIFDHAANGSGSDQSMLIPSANAGNWYILVYGESIPNNTGTFTLVAESREVVLTGSSTASISPNSGATIHLTGAGFKAGTTVSLVSSNGTVFTAISSTTDLITRVSATFAANSVPSGTYTIRVTQPSGATAEIPSGMVVQTGQGVLVTTVDAPEPIGQRVAATVYVSYANTGTAPMPAPLLELTCTNPAGLAAALLTLDPSRLTAGIWSSSAFPEGFSTAVQILASGATPGVLAPGESFRVPVYYAGWVGPAWDFDTIKFSSRILYETDTTFVDWPAMKESMRPAGISAGAWNVMYAGLASQLGTTWGGYVKLLNKQAGYLAGLGRNVTDINELWGSIAAQAANLWPMRTLGAVVDDSVPVPGALSLSFDRAFGPSIPGRFQSGPFGLGWSTSWQQKLTVAADGTVTRILGSGGRFTYQPDSRYAGRYFSRPGDYDVLTGFGGGYKLTALGGTFTVFKSDGVLDYYQDTNGNKITAGYTAGRLASMTASSGQFLALSYNSAGLVSSLTNSAGRTTNYSYDAANKHLLSVTSYTGLVTSFTYNTTPGAVAENALTSITRPGGVRLNLSYDSQGRLSGTSADGGQLANTFTYAEGRVNITDSASSTSSLFFDHNGQLAKAVDPLGYATYLDYDGRSNLISVTNALGATAEMTYNKVGQLISSTDFAGNTSNFVYGGPQKQLTALSDPKGNTTLYSYSTTGNHLKTTHANGKGESFNYDPLGNAVSFVNPAGQPIHYTHNASGQITGATFPDGSSYTYTYDTRNRLATATDSSGTTAFTYDATKGFMTKVAYPGSKSLTFSYDPAGRRSAMVDHLGFTVNYAYDPRGRLSTLKDGSGNLVVNYLYDSVGRLSRKNNGNGTYATYEYDASGQILHLVNRAPDNAVQSRFDYTYDSLGRRTSMETLDGKWTYTYDPIGQLTRAVLASTNPAVPSQDLRYAYDSAGNRTQVIENGVTTNYTTNEMNQYTGVGSEILDYDSSGNLIRRANGSAISEYAFDSLNRLVDVQTPEGSWAHNYDALGQRVGSTEKGTATRYLIDPFGLGDIAAEFDSAGNPLRHHFHGLGLVGSTDAQSRTYFHAFDALGNTSQLTGAGGTIQNQYLYTPFGELLTFSETTPNAFKGTSKNHDFHART